MNKQKTAIMQMFYGERGDSEKIKYSNECKECRNKSYEYYEKLCEKFKDDAEVLELFEKFIDWTERANVEEIDVNFAEGFKFGLLIGIEAGESMYE